MYRNEKLLKKEIIMGNCTGIIYGRVTNSSGSPIAGVEIDINWVQRAEGGALKIGGNENLNTFTPKCPTTKKGEYVIPFFWESAQVPGSIASALAMHWYNRHQYNALNRHGQLETGVDVRKLIGVVASPLPSDGPSAANSFVDFYISASEELKGMGILKRFVGSFQLLSKELQGCYCKINFVM